MLPKVTAKIYCPNAVGKLEADALFPVAHSRQRCIDGEYDRQVAGVFCAPHQSQSVVAMLLQIELEPAAGLPLDACGFLDGCRGERAQHHQCVPAAAASAVAFSPSGWASFW